MKKGFTLIEILIVMVLVGLSISIVIPNIGRSYDNIKFRSEAKKFQELMQKAKFHAFYYQKTVVVSEQNHQLAVQGLTLSEDEIPKLDVEIKGEILFSPNGVSSGGEVVLYLKDTPKAVIRVENFTGRITRKSL